MILKRYGVMLHSVRPDFDSRAMNEIGFRRDRRFSVRAADFDEEYEADGIVDVSSEADGPVQHEAEERLLRDLERELRRVEGEVDEGAVVVIESRQGTDYPKTRDRKQNVIRDGENRLHFHWTIHPPLRVGIYRRRV